MHLQHNQVSSNSVHKVIPTHTNGTILALVTCNHLISLFFSGSRQKQYILNEVIIVLYNVCLVLTEEETMNSVFCNQERKCGIVFGTSYCILTGSSPFHSHNNFNWHRHEIPDFS